MSQTSERAPGGRLRPAPIEPGPPGAVHPVPDHPLRRDGDLLLTGRAEFVDDIALPGMLHTALLRSPHAHARLLGVDVTRARSAPGVRAVLTSTEADALAEPLPSFFDPALVGAKTRVNRCLATDTVRYVGEVIAAVAADSLAEAEAAVDLIEVDYEPLPVVVDTEQALRDDAPLLFPEWGDNVLAMFPFAEGDADAAIAAAPHRISDEVHIQRYQTAPMEPRGYVAQWKPGGRLTVWASTQNPHPMRTNLATVLGIGEERVQVIAPKVGGGFGHKFNGYEEEYLVPLLARLAGRPVKWIETRADSLLVGAREYSHHFTVGFGDDGRILGIKDRIVGNVGSLSTWGGWPMTFCAGMTFPGPYKVADYDISSYAVVTNKAPWNGARGYGKESASLALERMVELIAERLDLDSVEVRRRNFIPEEEFPFWTAAKHLDSGNYAGALEKVLDLADYEGLRAEQRERGPAGPRMGVGIAFELTPEGGDFAGSYVRGHDVSTVRMHPTGAVTVLTGVTSPGTGNETTIATLVARELGIPADHVGVVQGDTDTCPFGHGNFSSRSVATGGAAAVLAAREVRARLTAAASALLGCPGTDLLLSGGRFAPAAGGDGMSVAEVADAIHRRALSVPGLDEPSLEVTRIDQPHNFHHAPDEKGRFSTYPSFPYSAHIAVVEVDPETGVVEVDRYFAVDDCGVVVSPTFVDGQLYGAIAMGIGGALWESLPYSDDGQPLAGHLKSYLLPRAPDLPMLSLASQHTPSPFTLLGTKGAGESGLGGAVAAVANAVNDALRPLGVHAHRMPLSPPNVLDAIMGGGTR
ncbi:MAG: aerobic carbon-monoxide dehydrogenase large subunit [Pseudonocardiales bacterium]|nr:aerobic carbon-monoxide dehydrogenase large subunit [Pseudonocardiales bacterium]